MWKISVQMMCKNSFFDDSLSANYEKKQMNKRKRVVKKGGSTSVTYKEGENILLKCFAKNMQLEQDQKSIRSRMVILNTKEGIEGKGLHNNKECINKKINSQ